MLVRFEKHYCDKMKTIDNDKCCEDCLSDSMMYYGSEDEYCCCIHQEIDEIKNGVEADSRKKFKCPHCGLKLNIDRNI